MCNDKNIPDNVSGMFFFYGAPFCLLDKSEARSLSRYTRVFGAFKLSQPLKAVLRRLLFLQLGRFLLHIHD